MMYASKILAASLIDLYLDKTIIQEAKKEFEENTKSQKYIAPLPEGTEPPFGQFKH